MQEKSTQKVLSVSKFVELTNNYLQTLTVTVQGEVVDFHIAKDRLVFFDLKDEKSRMGCFMLKWEMTQPIENGMEIEVTGAAGLFKTSGRFHFRVSSVTLKGEGTLARALEATKKKLEKEGLFSEEFKQKIPVYPQHIALLTSPDAAAYTDVIKVLKNRWVGLTVTFVPIGVQGASSVDHIVKALQYVNEHLQTAEAIILTRGGGSLEDLTAFNAESVVRAIFASRVPVVCGVGHERDWTLADLACDVRAATPSNAAELTVPDKYAVEKSLYYMQDRLIANMEQRIITKKQRVQELSSFLLFALERHLDTIRSILRRFTGILQQYEERILYTLSTLAAYVRRVIFAKNHLIETLRTRIIHFERLFTGLNPGAVLHRGYSITFDKEGKIIKDIHTLSRGESLTTHLARGKVESMVHRLYGTKKRKN